MVSGANTQREIKRRFYVSMLGSLNQLAMGGSEGGCWSTQNGKRRCGVPVLRRVADVDAGR